MWRSTSELDVPIRRVERVAVGGRLRRLELQHVLRADLIELFRDEVDGGGVDTLELPLVDGDADHHPLRHQIFERHILVCRHRQNRKTGGNDTQVLDGKRSHGAEHCMAA